MRTVPARHIAVGASVLVMAAGAFTVPAAAAAWRGTPPEGPDLFPGWRQRGLSWPHHA